MSYASTPLTLGARTGVWLRRSRVVCGRRGGERNIRRTAHPEPSKRDEAQERIRRAALVTSLPRMRTAIRVVVDLVEAGRADDAEEELRRWGLIDGRDAFRLLVAFWRDLGLEEPHPDWKQVHKILARLTSGAEQEEARTAP